MKKEGHLRIATDVGGTFTDVATFDERQWEVSSGKSTFHARRTGQTASKLAVSRTGCEVAEATLFLHGSTIAINTMLERSGAKAASADHQRLS